MRRKVKRWKSAPSRHVKVGDAVLYKPLKVKLVDQEKPSKLALSVSSEHTITKNT